MSFQSDDLIWKREGWRKFIEFVLSISYVGIGSQVCHVVSVNENKRDSILEILNVDWKRTGLINKHFSSALNNNSENSWTNVKMRNEKCFFFSPNI